MKGTPSDGILIGLVLCMAFGFGCGLGAGRGGALLKAKECAENKDWCKKYAPNFYDAIHLPTPNREDEG